MTTVNFFYYSGIGRIMTLCLADIYSFLGNFIEWFTGQYWDVVTMQLIYILIGAFSKSRILSWETGYLVSISTTFRPLETKSSDHFKNLQKPKLLTKFHDDLTSPLKVVSKWKSVLRCSQCSFARINLQPFTFEINPLSTRKDTSQNGPEMATEVRLLHLQKFSLASTSSKPT